MPKICVGFNYDSLPKCNQEYLYDMYLAIKFGNRCPKTFKSMDALYPNRGNFKLFADRSKLDGYINSSSKRNETYASHLLSGKKFWIVWTCDSISSEES